MNPLDPLFREAGTALNPDRHDTESLLRRKEAHPRIFASLWQQTPRPIGGSIIKVEWLKTIHPELIPPEKDMKIVRAYDLAFGRRVASADIKYTACAKVGMYPHKDGTFTFYLLEVQRWKALWPETKRRICSLAFSDTSHVIIGMEAGGPQRAASDDLQTVTELRNFKIVTDTPVGDKESRAWTWIDRAERGTLLLKEDSWNKDFISECEIFPGSYTDQVDALSLAMKILTPYSHRSVTTILYTEGLYS
jgi:predicted phage terminase large subunit-like protein